jgi:putative endonuclease
MPHKVYILISKIKDPWSYVGSTSDIEQRFKDHKWGKVKSTKGYRPLEIIHTEDYKAREEAYKRELYLKSGIGREERYEIVKKHKINQKLNKND